ncbi:hypothetical protein BU16DRAFT_554120 [Lophium mytilinum]|uniref:Uncharacterized protein n=1 Tax=Lophium mytilinum TaxID=390894 RepID=A0A6A6RCE5_9PEZI|nr:hypothetical protein BU16DRAFT_554120 [Lophium mytilinum]
MGIAREIVTALRFCDFGSRKLTSASSTPLQQHRQSEGDATPPTSTPPPSLYPASNRPTFCHCADRASRCLPIPHPIACQAQKSELQTLELCAVRLSSSAALRVPRRPIDRSTSPPPPNISGNMSSSTDFSRSAGSGIGPFAQLGFKDTDTSQGLCNFGLHGLPAKHDREAFTTFWPGIAELFEHNTFVDYLLYSGGLLGALMALWLMPVDWLPRFGGLWIWENATNQACCCGDLISHMLSLENLPCVNFIDTAANPFPPNPEAAACTHEWLVHRLDLNLVWEDPRIESGSFQFLCPSDHNHKCDWTKKTYNERRVEKQTPLIRPPGLDEILAQMQMNVTDGNAEGSGEGMELDTE